MTEERCKQIMEQLGQPHSRSLMQVIFQVANETEQEVRKKLTSDNSDYEVQLKASPKLPSLEDVIDEVSDHVHRETIKETYYAIQRLGNFA